MNTAPNQDSEIYELWNIVKRDSLASSQIGSPGYNTRVALAALKQRWSTEARIDENESLLTVAEHEISLPDHCEMHDKYASACHACKKRKWYGEISKDWKRIIEIRLAELKATLQPGEEGE